MGYADRSRLDDALSLDAQPWRLRVPVAWRRRHSYSYTNGYCHSDGHSYSYCYSNGDAYTQGYAYAKASPHTKASPVDTTLLVISS
jgi:hypothetical protein